MSTGNHHHFPALQRPWQNKAKEQKLGQLKRFVILQLANKLI